MEAWLDEGSGSCLLRVPGNSSIVGNALRYFDGERYVMGPFVVMPNHVHVLFRLLHGHRLESVLKSWKGFTAREINRRMGRSGALWQEEYWDRLVRNERHWKRCAQYICENPLRARLPEGAYLLSGG
ncbi:MAG: transposase [Opitutales bacterium]|nr:transposase [Opitutales bacterium]